MSAYRPKGLSDEEYALYQSLKPNDGMRIALHFRQAATDNGVAFSICDYNMLDRGEVIRVA